MPRKPVKKAIAKTTTLRKIQTSKPWTEEEVDISNEELVKQFPPELKTGLRYDEGKPRYDLIPPEFLEALAKHLAAGNLKYPDPTDRHWERGMKWSTVFRAIMSHCVKRMRGERFENDPAMPGYAAPHSIAIAWNAMVLFVYETRQIGDDNLPRAAFFDETKNAST